MHMKESSFWSTFLQNSPYHKTLKFQEKSNKNAFSRNLQILISKMFPSHCLPWDHPTEPLSKANKNRRNWIFARTDLPTKNFQNLEMRLFRVTSKTGSFYLKTRRLEPKAKLWLAEPLLHCPDKISSEEISSYKFDESSCAFFDAILKMISPSEFLLDVNKNRIQNR